VLEQSAQPTASTVEFATDAQVPLQNSVGALPWLILQGG
jgi:hypothetical protein